MNAASVSVAVELDVDALERDLHQIGNPWIGDKIRNAGTVAETVRAILGKEPKSQGRWTCECCKGNRLFVGDRYDPRSTRRTRSWPRGDARYPWQTRSDQLPRFGGDKTYNKRIDPDRLIPEDGSGVTLRCLVCLRPAAKLRRDDKLRQDQVCRPCEQAWRDAGKPWDDSYDEFVTRRRSKVYTELVLAKVEDRNIAALIVAASPPTDQIHRTLPNSRQYRDLGGQKPSDQGVSMDVRYTGAAGEIDSRSLVGPPGS